MTQYNPDDQGVLSIMYHRFEENKYPSTNVRMEMFEKQLQIVKELNYDFYDPSRLISEFEKPKERKRRNSFYFDDELICEEDEMKHGRQLMLKCDRGVWKPGTLIRKHSKERRSSSGKKDYQERLYKVCFFYSLYID